jgi:uncharacterized protein YecA (UPF0149 family)
MNKPEGEVVTTTTHETVEAPKEPKKEVPLFEDGSLESKVVLSTKTPAGIGRAYISRLSAGKVIRGNATCPCGSGKKFKKCCRS